jgi:hypothetical protein
MRIECECGEIVDVPAGQPEVECPNCGRALRSGEDWLESLDVEDLAIEQEAAQAEPEPEAEGPAPAPEKGVEQETDVVETEEAAPEAPPEAERVPPEEPEGPKNLLALARQALGEPEEAFSWVRRGVKSPALMQQLAGALVILVFLAALGRSYLSTPMDMPHSMGLDEIVRNFVALFIEAGVATGFLWAMCVGFQHDPDYRVSPLGVVEGMVALRIGVLLVMVPIALLLMLGVAVAGREGIIGDAANLIRTWYTLLLVLGHALLVVPLFKAGCGKGLVLSVVLSYSGYWVAARIAP